MFKCKERNEIMTSETCYKCFMTKRLSVDIDTTDSRPLCKDKNKILLDPSDLPADALKASDAAPNQTYRTANNILIQLEKMNDGRVKMYLRETGNCVEVPGDTVVFSDISKILVDKGYQEEKNGEIKIRGEKEKRETKTSYIDNLLSEGTEFNKIVELVTEKYKEDVKKIKRLVWSRRATLKKSKNNDKNLNPSSEW